MSYRNLSLRIKSDEYHRLSPVTRDKLETNKKIKSGEEVLNPIIVRTNNLKKIPPSGWKIDLVSL